MESLLGEIVKHEQRTYQATLDRKGKREQRENIE
jgi:hypothetical protein